MWCVATFETAAAGLEVVASAEAFAIQAGQEFRGGVSVEVRQAEGVGRYIPSWTEPKEVGQGSVGVARLGGKDSVDGGIGVVDAGCVLGCELGEVVLQIVLVDM